MAERWNGKRWSVQPVAVPAAPNSFLTGVSCTSTTACTAVGDAFADSSFNNTVGTVAERWNGTTWSLQPSPKARKAPTTSWPPFPARPPVPAPLSGIRIRGCSPSGGTEEPEPGHYKPQSRRRTRKETATSSTATPAPRPRRARPWDSSSGRGASHRQRSAERWDGTQCTVPPTPTLPGAYDITPPAVSCPTVSFCTAAAGFTNDGPPVTLAEQWNRQTGSTVLTLSPLKGGSASQGSCTRPLVFGSSQTPSPLLRFRPASQTARASSGNSARLTGADHVDRTTARNTPDSLIGAAF